MLHALMEIDVKLESKPPESSLLFHLLTKLMPRNHRDVTIFIKFTSVSGVLNK